MTLRKRPETSIIAESDTAVTSPRKNGTRNGTTTAFGARRSQRSAGSGRNSILPSASNNSRLKPIHDEELEDTVVAKKMKSENKAKADQQEERSLIRALNSYGPESHSLVRSHILPVYGSTRRRSFKHISDRWKRLREDRKENESTSTAERAKSWEAKHVVSDNWDTHFARIAKDAAKEASVSKESVGPSKAPRRSLRGSKRRSFFDS